MCVSPKRPLVSFIVRAHNLEKYLGKCLDSILSQAFDDYEIVLINNHSRDGSERICRDYAAASAKIRYYRLEGEHTGGDAIIAGVRQSSGEYIHLIDGDDELAPKVYDKIAAVLQRERPDVLFGGFSSILDEKIVSFADTPFDPKHINGQTKDAALTYLSQKQPFILATWRLIVSRRLSKLYARTLMSVVPIAYGAHFDVFISIRILIAARSIRYMENPLYRYRVRSASISRASEADQVLDCMKFMINLDRYMGETAMTDSERFFAYAYAKQYFFQLSAALCTLTDEQVMEVAIRIAEAFMPNSATSKLFSASPVAASLIHAVLSKGDRAGIVSHRASCMAEVKRVARIISAKQGRVYLAPTGNIGLYMKHAFSSVGVKISGFFDNDRLKDGMLLADAPVRLPSFVKEIAEQITIVIASRYANVRDEMYDQFIELGIEKDHLLVFEF